MQSLCCATKTGHREERVGAINSEVGPSRGGGQGGRQLQADRTAAGERTNEKAPRKAPSMQEPHENRAISNT